MGVARIRCTACHQYVNRTEIYREAALSRVCSEECWSALLDRRRIKPKASKKAAPRKRKPGLDLALRREIRERDGGLCRMCGDKGAHVHHARYRSEDTAAFVDVPHNLILLCAICHETVHSSKRVWQPLVLGVLYRHYVDGVFVTIPQFSQWYAAVTLDAA